MKVFLDANVFLRFYVKEDVVTHGECVELISLCNQGLVRPYTSSIVISEVIYVLLKLYKFPKIQVLAAIDDLLNLRNLTVAEKTDTRKAVELFKKQNVKIGDCLISTQVPEGVVLCTYDTDFARIADLKIIRPGELVNKKAN